MKFKGKQVYLTPEELELLFDVYASDVNYSSTDTKAEDKDKVFEKIFKGTLK